MSTSRDMKDAMKSRFPVWSAVLAGMASPASLYAEPQNYHAYARIKPAGYGFAVAGSYLTKSMAGQGNDGQLAPTAKSRRPVRKG